MIAPLRITFYVQILAGLVTLLMSRYVILPKKMDPIRNHPAVLFLICIGIAYVGSGTTESAFLAACLYGHLVLYHDTPTRLCSDETLNAIRRDIRSFRIYLEQRFL